MSKINDGGPAFPLDDWGDVIWPTDVPANMGTGLTKREWFAGQALAGYFANPHTPHQNADDCAEYMYRVADAMIAESQKQEPLDV